MGKLLRRLVPIAAVFAWRNREQLADWYRSRNEADHDTSTPTTTDTTDATPTQTQIAPIPNDPANA